MVRIIPHIGLLTGIAFGLIGSFGNYFVVKAECYRCGFLGLGYCGQTTGICPLVDQSDIFIWILLPEFLLLLISGPFDFFFERIFDLFQDESYAFLFLFMITYVPLCAFVGWFLQVTLTFLSKILRSLMPFDVDFH